MPTQRDRELARARARRQASVAPPHPTPTDDDRSCVSAVLVVAIIVDRGARATGGGSGKKSPSAASTPSATALVTPSAHDSRGRSPAGEGTGGAGQADVRQGTGDDDRHHGDVRHEDDHVVRRDRRHMDAAKTPHTVNSFAFLASKHYFDGIHFRGRSPPPRDSRCCRAATSPATAPVLPATASLTRTSRARSTPAARSRWPTPAGEPGGSQFFLIDQTTTALAAAYTPFGTITKGIDVLDKLLAIGNDSSNQAGGGVPKQTIYINTLTVTKV